MFETLQQIVDQLEYCRYQTKDGLHDLKMNRAFIALKERAALEPAGAQILLNCTSCHWRDRCVCKINGSVCRVKYERKTSPIS